VRIHVAGFGVRVTLHDPATGVHLWHLDPATDARTPVWVFPDRAAALTFIEDTLAQHDRAQGWPRNAASETKMLEQDIPTLMAWYVAGDRPDTHATRRRLRALARHVLALDAPPSDAVAFPESRGTPAKGRRKTAGRFFVRLPENSV
jgi:hypothetical protein